MDATVHLIGLTNSVVTRTGVDSEPTSAELVFDQPGADGFGLLPGRVRLNR